MSETMADFSSELNNSMRVINAGDMVTGTVVGVSDTEVTVDLQYFAEGIIRAADYSGDPSFNIRQDVEIGAEVTAVVLRMDDGHGNILLSRRKANEILIWDKLKELLKNKTHITVKIAQAVKGGAVAYYEGIRAFIPASKIALSFIEDLETFVGREVDAIVITADEENKRLVLSVRDVLREKAEEEKAKMVSNLKVGFVTEGTVESLKDYGAFVGIGNGIDGLLHISQIPSDKRLKHPKEVLNVGDKVKVRVTRIQDGRISLSMRALEEEAPAEELVEEKVVLPKSEKLTTNLGSLLAGLNLPEE
ncbi:MAG: S1 RNA-binding domain-containing protein [Lachnospiraceae bacterium]|nr:S1 RNA-binding domain-containing protein [Lachnospiraceae bacterium]